ncbi:MAG: isoprenylcysteine carboxyl methyltransferase family protein [Methyloligellaceae bacterium]
MVFDFIGPAQIAALLILLQRGLEELYSQRNTKRLLADGAKEAGRDYYPVVAAAHLGWIAGLFFLISPNTPIYWFPLALFLVLQIVRYWVIATLGRYWTHRIITLAKAPVVRKGPYGFIRHPNYAVTIAETALLPAAFGAWALAAIMTAIWMAVIAYKIKLEDQALAERRAQSLGVEPETASVR